MKSVLASLSAGFDRGEHYRDLLSFYNRRDTASLHNTQRDSEQFLYANAYVRINKQIVRDTLRRIPLHLHVWRAFREHFFLLKTRYV